MSAARQKWEYCAIVGIGRRAGQRYLGPFYPAFWRFRNERVDTAELKGDESAQVAQAIFQLGQDGWEMVGAVPDTQAGNANSHTLYFKRPIDTQDYPATTG